MFSLKKNLKFITIDQKYLKTLHDSCSEVYYKPSGYESKPYIGILVEDNGIEYVIPLSSAKENTRHGNMIRIILQGKYDIDSFYYNDTLEIKISNKEETRLLNFGNRIVYTKFYEEELVNEANFLYYSLLKKTIKNTTLIQDSDSILLKKIENDTGNFYSKDELKHYVLIAENHIMEVVSFDDVKTVSQLYD